MKFTRINVLISVKLTANSVVATVKTTYTTRLSFRYSISPAYVPVSTICLFSFTSFQFSNQFIKHSRERSFIQLELLSALLTNVLLHEGREGRKALVENCQYKTKYQPSFKIRFVHVFNINFFFNKQYCTTFLRRNNVNYKLTDFWLIAYWNKSFDESNSIQTV